MRFKGTLKALSRDFMTGRINLQFEMEEGNMTEVEGLRDIPLSIEAKKYRKDRSLNANALLWQCIGEIAKALNTDKWEVYLSLLKKYGKYTYICVKPQVVDAVKAQWRECEVLGEIDINGQKAVQLLCYFGSSTYDSKEFSQLLEGTVTEMEQMGLERPTTQEMERTLQQWQKELSQ